MAKVDFTAADKALADAEAAQTALKAWVSGATGDQALALKAQNTALSKQVADLTADVQRLKGQLKDAQDSVDLYKIRFEALAATPSLPL